MNEGEIKRQANNALIKELKSKWPETSNIYVFRKVGESARYAMDERCKTVGPFCFFDQGDSRVNGTPVSSKRATVPGASSI